MLEGGPNVLQPTFFAFTPTRISLIITKVKHAFLQESRCCCPRCIFCIPCTVCPNSVRKSTSRGERPDPPDGLIPIESVSSSLEPSLKSRAPESRSKSSHKFPFPCLLCIPPPVSFPHVSRCTLPPCILPPCILASRVLSAPQSAQPMLPRAGPLPSWKGALRGCQGKSGQRLRTTRSTSVMLSEYLSFSFSSALFGELIWL